MNYSQRIYNEVKRYNFPDALANLIAAQAAHETGNFTSGVFTDCLNCFGYKSLSTTTNCPGHPAYKLYPTVEASADEVVNWILRRQSEGKFPADLSTINTPDYYAQLLKNAGYFEDTAANYSAGISNYLVNLATPANGLILAAAIITGILLIRARS